MDNLEKNTETQNKFKPFSFKGRIGRKTYRNIYIMYIILYIIAFILIYIGHKLDDDIYINDNASIIIVVAALTLIAIATWIYCASATKRFHDLGHSGRKLFFLPFGLSSLFSKDGEPGDNEYGPNPKGE